MLIKVGVKYAFNPPVRASGFEGEGDATKETRGLFFPRGTCVEIGLHAHKFTSLIWGKKFKFFVDAEPKSGGSTMTPIA